MHIKVVCEYIGTNFSGFQTQVGKRTVQSELESAFSKYFNTAIKVVGSGRTDAGVHAFGQIISFLCPVNEVNLYKMLIAVNSFLPDDLSVKDAETKEKFNARSDAKAKTYIYKCYVSPSRSAVRDKFYHQIYKPVDILQLKLQAASLVGSHDFTALCSELGDKSPIRTIYSCDIKTENDEVWFIIRGNGFLKNMVRIIVGTLLEGKNMENVLKSKNRKFAGKTAPAKGLTLFSVEY